MGIAPTSPTGPRGTPALRTCAAPSADERLHSCSTLTELLISVPSEEEYIWKWTSPRSPLPETSWLSSGSCRSSPAAREVPAPPGCTAATDLQGKSKRLKLKLGRCGRRLNDTTHNDAPHVCSPYGIQPLVYLGAEKDLFSVSSSKKDLVKLIFKYLLFILLLWFCSFSPRYLNNRNKNIFELTQLFLHSGVVLRHLNSPSSEVPNSCRALS